MFANNNDTIRKTDPSSAINMIGGRNGNNWGY